MESEPYYALVTAALKYEPSVNLYISKDGSYYKKIGDIPGSARAKFKKMFSPYYEGIPYEEQAKRTGIIKEKEVEIGGRKCHLCGADYLYGSTEKTELKKYFLHERHLVYECGTQIFSVHRTKPEDSVQYKNDRHIHAECI